MASAKKSAPLRQYAAFLRGISPMNAKMPELKRCFEKAGFTDVRTLLSSGNVVFHARPTAEATLQRQAEAAMQQHLGRSFLTIVRSLDSLRAWLEADPYRRFRLAPGSKRVVTFLHQPGAPPPKLPIVFEDARILCVQDGEAFSAYIPGPRGPVFMTLIEKTFGSAVTTRTWDTVRKTAAT